MNLGDLMNLIPFNEKLVITYYKNGEIILAGRYVSSNAIHQMCKLEDSEHNAYLDWLFDYEYEIRY